MEKGVAARCFRCNSALTLPDGPVGRSESCPHCGVDVRVCRNCRHYDEKSYNECRENQAERVVDKEKRTFCDYFTLGGAGKDDAEAARLEALKKLDSLFKK